MPRSWGSALAPYLHGYIGAVYNDASSAAYASFFFRGPTSLGSTFQNLLTTISVNGMTKSIASAGAPNVTGGSGLVFLRWGPLSGGAWPMTAGNTYDIQIS